MSLHSGYLTGRQLSIWDLLRKGHSQSDIARRLHITRQAVSQLAQTIPDKVSAALYDAARLNRIDPRHVDSVRGVLLGWSKEFQAETIITFSSRTGLNLWYQHELGRCRICPDKGRCRAALLENAKEFGIALNKAEKEQDPSKLSGLIFAKLLGPAYSPRINSIEAPNAKMASA